MSSLTTVELLFCLFLYSTLWSGVTIHYMQLRSRELCSTFFKAEYLNKLFGIVLQEICLLSFIIYLFNHLFILVLIYEYLFLILSDDPILFYLFHCSFFFSILGTLSVHIYATLINTYWCMVDFFVFCNFLALTLWHYKILSGSSGVFPAPVQELIIYSRNSSFFFYEWY